MKRIIATVLLGSLILFCFASCDDLVDAEELLLEEEHTTEAPTKKPEETPTTEYPDYPKREEPYPFATKGASDLIAELKQKNIDPNAPRKYTVHVTIITIEDKSVTNEFSIEKLTEILGDSNRAYEEHCKKEKEYFKSLNESVAETLGITNLEYHAADYGPYIFLEYDNVSDYAVCEKQLIDAIENHSDILKNARVNISYFAEITEKVG